LDPGKKKPERDFNYNYSARERGHMLFCEGCAKKGITKGGEKGGKNIKVTFVAGHKN